MRKLHGNKILNMLRLDFWLMRNIIAVCSAMHDLRRWMRFLPSTHPKRYPRYKVPQTSGRQDVRTSGRQDVRMSGRSDVRTCGRPGRPDVRTSGRPDVRMSERLDVRTSAREGPVTDRCDDLRWWMRFLPCMHARWMRFLGHHRIAPVSREQRGGRKQGG